MSEYDESFEVCDDCGRQFPRSELRRCKICGHYVCPECRSTHVAKFHKSGVGYNPGHSSAEESSIPQHHEEPESAVPSFTMHQEEPAPSNSDSSSEDSSIPSFVFHREETPRAAEPTPVRTAVPRPEREQTLTCVDCGRTFPISRMKKCNICNGAVCPQCSETHLSRKHGSFLYTEYTSEPSSAESYSSHESAPSYQKNTGSEFHFKEDFDRNPIGHAASFYDYSARPASSSHHDDTVISPSDVGNGRVKCDDCGEYFSKDELRTCRKCGRHVCSNCRTHHKCPKPQKPQKPEKPPKEPKAPKPPKEPKQPKPPKPPKAPKPPKQHKRRHHDELGDPIY